MKFSDKSKVFMYASLVFSGVFMTCFLVYILIIAKFTTHLSDRDLIARDFLIYLKRHGKAYRGEELKMRLKNFERSMKAVDFLNKPYIEPRFGPTKFSDMSVQEFEGTILMNSRQPACKPKNKSCFSYNRNGRNDVQKHKKKRIPVIFDWRDYGVIGPVLDQKLCLNCWAFSIIGVMESMLMISNQTQNYKRLSVQELTDCSNYTYKCSISSVVKAVDFICNKHWPIVPESKYPLTLKKQECKIEKPNEGVMIMKYKVGCDLNSTQLARIIVSHGPVAATVNARSWQNYVGGVIKYHCGGLWEQTNHVVQIVGYDMEAPEPYFILRNSWGRNFGDNGYVYIAMDNFLCAVGRQITYFDAFYSRSSRKRKIQVDAA